MAIPEETTLPFSGGEFLRISSFESLIGSRQSKIGNFDRKAVAPTVLLAGEFLSQLPLFAICFRVKHPTRSSPLALSDANFDLGVALDILHPVCAVKVLGKKV